MISTKNKAHWHSYKKVAINVGSLRNSSSTRTSYKFKFKVFDVSDFKTHYRFGDIIITILCKKNEKFSEVCKRFRKYRPLDYVHDIEEYKYYFNNIEINKDLTIGQIGLKNDSEVIATYHNKIVG